MEYQQIIVEDRDAIRIVTLNRPERVDQEKILRKFIYHHPVYTRRGPFAQKRHDQINGVNRTYYCGAYWRNGFHEDGVVSGLTALSLFEQRDRYAQPYLQRAS